jgi:pyruvate/2-oxoglutarate dehydrogenase complex dihydrolipoamide acyltransferase (E2) component
MDVKMNMPDLSTTSDDVRVIRWLVEIGQVVKRGENILEVETDKASMDVEAIASGVIKEIHAKPDQEVAAGELIAIIDTKGGGA